MMLFALMLKVDVGWGQGGCTEIPPELLVNPDLAINMTATQGTDAYAFPNSLINGWRCSHGTPHYIGLNNGSCFYSSGGNAPFPFLFDFPDHVTCVAASTWSSDEGFYQTLNCYVKSDPLLTYTLTSNVGLLPCGGNNNNGLGILDFRLTNALNPNTGCDITNVEQFYPQSYLIRSQNLTSNIPTTVSVTFNGSVLATNYSQFWILQPANNNGKLAGIYDVSLTCASSALTGIDVPFGQCLAYTFEPIEVRPFADYEWCIDGNIVSKNKIFNHTFAQQGTYEVCLRVLDECGCLAHECITVNAMCPTPDAGFTSSGDCPDYQFNVTNPQICDIYRWEFGDGATSNVQNPAHTYVANGTYTVRLTVTNCGQVSTSTQEVLVNCLCPIPTVNFTYIVNCMGHSNEVSFTSNATGEGLTYLWNFGDGNTSTQQNPIYSYATNGNKTVTLTVTDACGESRTVEKTISVLCSPPGNISCGRNTYENAYLIDASSGDINFYQYVLQNGVPFINIGELRFSGLTFVVRGNLIMDKRFTFLGCTFVFDGGASLILDNTSKSHNIIFHNSKLFACGDVMWKGVKSLNGKHYFINGSEIRDAEYGIEAYNDGNISARGAKFYNNIVGIYVRSNAGHLIGGNNFERNDLIKGPYSNQFIYRDPPYAGVVFDGISNGVVGSNLASDKNIFRDISVGIVSYKTNLICIGNDFKNLWGQNGFYDPEDKWKGTGDNIFIYGGSNHTIAKNEFPESNDGCLHLRKMALGQVNIFQNKVQTSSSAFNFSHNQGVNLKIFEHKESYNIGSKIEAFRGINYDASNSECNFDIYQNEFKSSTSSGVRSWESIDIGGDQRLANINIRNNTFNILNMRVPFISPNGKAINPSAVRIFNAWNINIINNEFISTTTDVHDHLRVNFSRGVIEDNMFKNYSGSNNTVENAVKFDLYTSNWRIGCNESHGVTNGFNFSDDLAVSSGINFESNLMMDNIIGLRVNNGINPQFNKGNLWNGINRKAQLLNANDPSLSLFSVNFDQVAPQSQPGASYKPYVVDPNFWFDDIELDADGCFGNRPLGLNDEDSTSMDHISYLRNLMDSQEDISNLQRWVYNERIYQEIKSIGDNSNEYLAQIIGQIPTEIVEYDNLDLSFRQILALTSLEKSSLDEIRLELDFLESERQQLFAEYDELEEWSNEIISQIDYINARIAQLKSLENNVLNDISERKSEQLGEFKALVESTNETEIFHEYMKVIHIVMSDLHLYGLDFVNSTHREILELIASLCYKEYGISVYSASTILGTLDGHDYTGEVDICNATENRQAGINAESSSIKIYPNPTSDKLNIEYNESIIKTEILDLSGRKLMDLSVSKDIIDISVLDEGVYFLTITGESGNKITVKFIKIK